MHTTIQSLSFIWCGGSPKFNLLSLSWCCGAPFRVYMYVHNVHRITLHSHSLKIMIVESFSENMTCWGAVVFEKRVKQCHGNNFRLSDHETTIILACKNVFSWHCFTHFPKTTAAQQLIFQGTLSTIIIFKQCKFNVNLWKLCFELQKVPKSFKKTQAALPSMLRIKLN